MLPIFSTSLILKTIFLFGLIFSVNQVGTAAFPEIPTISDEDENFQILPKKILLTAQRFKNFKCHVAKHKKISTSNSPCN